MLNLKIKGKTEPECKKFRRINFWNQKTRKIVVYIYAKTTFVSKLSITQEGSKQYMLSAAAETSTQIKKRKYVSVEKKELVL